MFTRRSTLAFAAAALLAAPAFGADDRIKVVTTFTVIADMAANVAGDAAEVVSVTKPGAEIHGYQPTPRDLIKAQDADLVLWNGLNLERWFEQFFANLRDVPAAVVSDGVDPMPIAGGEYDGKPNPHGWMALSSALIYVDNIRDALSSVDPDNAATYAANAEAYKQQIADTIGPLRDAALALPEERRWLVTSRGRVFLSRARFRAEGALSLADQRRRAGHAAAGARGDRRGARTRYPGGLLRKHGVGQAREADRARDRRGLRRRALRRQPERSRRAGAHLSRPPCGSPAKPS